MGNMKNANHLTVVYGEVPEEVLMFACKDFALDDELIEGEVNIARVNDETYVYYEAYDRPVPESIVSNALGCLHDHIANVPTDQLGLQLEEPRYHCCNEEHIAPPKLQCRDSLPDCIHCNVYRYIYYAQDCVVSVYYIQKD